LEIVLKEKSIFLKICWW